MRDDLLEIKNKNVMKNEDRANESEIRRKREACAWKSNHINTEKNRFFFRLKMLKFYYFHCITRNETKTLFNCFQSRSTRLHCIHSCVSLHVYGYGYCVCMEYYLIMLILSVYCFVDQTIRLHNFKLLFHHLFFAVFNTRFLCSFAQSFLSFSFWPLSMCWKLRHRIWRWIVMCVCECTWTAE